MSGKSLTKNVIIIILGMLSRSSAFEKSTNAASDPMHSLAFMLKYLPVTVAEDEGTGNYMSGDVQGRVQTLKNTSYTERNCQLYSSKGQLTSGDTYTSMTQNGLGKACSYNTKKKYTSGVQMHKVFAYNKVQCCNSCVATEGCVGATFLASSNDHSGGQGPQSWEGFGIHTVNVTGASTTGGISVDELEAKFRSRFGSGSDFDQFMDYSVTFFTPDLKSYYDAFKKDQVPFFLGQWDTDTEGTWYSLVFLVNRSTYVIELVSPLNPSVGAQTLPKLEQRMSSRRCGMYRHYPTHPARVVFPASINRAASNISMIDDVYTQLFKFSSTDKIDKVDVTRRCYNAPTASQINKKFPPGPGGRNFDVDICFSKRAADAKKDEIFSVLDFEQMLWSEHAGTLANGPNGQDKYTDNHYSGFSQDGISSLQAHFKANPPYPITAATRLAYACKQCYIIDPTGWSIQPGGPDCSDWSNLKCNGFEPIVV